MILDAIGCLALKDDVIELETQIVKVLACLHNFLDIWCGGQLFVIRWMLTYYLNIFLLFKQPQYTLPIPSLQLTASLPLKINGWLKDETSLCGPAYLKNQPNVGEYTIHGSWDRNVLGAYFQGANLLLVSGNPN